MLFIGRARWQDRLVYLQWEVRAILWLYTGKRVAGVANGNEWEFLAGFRLRIEAARKAKWEVRG